MNDTSHDHRPQSGDRNNDYVANNDKPQQEKRDREVKEGEEKMDEISKRDEGIR